ncbi:MAG TPA: sulfite exporter TauE/SafE family protein [Rhodocyclaceae bacterium]|nr:sulfite exporter TauE/SafE family protein [Rhodocyclaceae bacterium]
MEQLILYVATGAVIGVIAGLMGIGGGIVVVPVLTLIFTTLHFPHEHLLHLALGTSLATILFTSVSSVRAHHVRGAVNWDVVKQLTPGVLIGTLAGTWVAAQLTTPMLKSIFIVFAYYVAVQMLLNVKPKPTRQLPASGGLLVAGHAVGGFSSLVGIGGGTVLVPLMTMCNVAMHTAVGTAAAVGFPIALAGTAGYIANGFVAGGLPEYSFGYVYLPAFVGIAVTSMLTAPLGARLAHALPVAQLKKVFAVVLVLVATRMLLEIV